MSYLDKVFLVFAVVSVISAIGFGLLLHLSKDVKFKKKVFQFSVISAGAIFIVFAYFIRFPGEVYYFIVPAVFLIIFLNLIATKFCNECGKMAVIHNPFAKPKYCSKCGTELNT